MQVGDYELKDDLKYDKNNNWVKVEGDTAVFGISDAGVKRAKEIAFVELPNTGDKVEQGKACGQIESAKWAGEIIAPVGGEVVEVNQAVADDPSCLNNAPYDNWIAKIKMSDPGQADGLMDAGACAEWLKSS